MPGYSNGKVNKYSHSAWLKRKLTLSPLCCGLKIQVNQSASYNTVTGCAYRSSNSFSESRGNIDDTQLAALLDLFFGDREGVCDDELKRKPISIV